MSDASARAPVSPIPSGDDELRAMIRADSYSIRIWSEPARWARDRTMERLSTPPGGCMEVVS
jgi:hypothetical protein